MELSYNGVAAAPAITSITVTAGPGAARRFGPPPPYTSAVAVWESVKLVARTNRWAFAGSVSLAIALGVIAIYAPLDIGLVTQWSDAYSTDAVRGAAHAACAAFGANHNTTMLVGTTAVATSTLSVAACALAAFPPNQRTSVIITAGLVVCFMFAAASIRLTTLFITDTKTTGRLTLLYGEVKGATQAAGARAPLPGIDVAVTDAWGVGLLLAGAAALFGAWACIFKAAVLAGLYVALVGAFLFKYAVGNAVGVTLKVQTALLEYIEAVMLEAEKPGAMAHPEALTAAFSASRAAIAEHVAPLLKVQGARGVLADLVA